jgi:serine protease Do
MSTRLRCRGTRWSRYATLFVWLALVGVLPAESSEQRRTAVVRAAQQARPSIVNIRGQKTVGSQDVSGGHVEAPRRVNGMGTGVVLDARGYIVTNHHVIDGVAQINVTLADGSQHRARIVSHDPRTDLAMIKIDAGQHRLPVIEIGTSSDLMPGEPVIAVGNAYGYEHTVTRGIISALHRTVQVSDSQNYYDLIQTDASINPGNSGGPLLNIDGEMIGINVAVRVGAQGIGFALPVDNVMEVAAKLLSIERLDHNWHGVEAVSAKEVAAELVVESVEPGSPAADAGLRSGDIIRYVEDQQVQRALDLELALLGSQTGRQVDLEVKRQDENVRLNFTLAALPNRSPAPADRTWRTVGLRLQQVPSSRIGKSQSRYRGGLLVTDVRPKSPASEQGIKAGDILVGMHIWETISVENVSYVLNHRNRADFEPLKFYIVRGSQTLYGHMRIASLQASRSSSP